jgi:glyoxylase-like metal-dependent hydrolase (beta-lactamase superfamily II)
MSEYTITPLVLAMGMQREKSRFTYMSDYGKKIDIPYISWLIQDRWLNVLVDSACSADQYQRWIKPVQRALFVGGEQFQDVIDVIPLDEALERHGLTVDDIEIFIQTHLDWDHCMSTHRFKKARVIIQRAELDDFPVHPLFARAHPPTTVIDEIKRLSLDIVDGDVNVADDLDLLFTPGHTAGGQLVRVNTLRGRYVIGGLCTILDDYYVKPEIVEQLGYDIIPPGTHLDARVAYASCQRVRDEAGANVLPLHEPTFVSLGRIG